MKLPVALIFAGMFAVSVNAQTGPGVDFDDRAGSGFTISNLFSATLHGDQVTPPTFSPGGGSAFLAVNLDSREWSLTGEISNLVGSATSVAIYGPALVGETADLLFTLGHNVEPDGPLDGTGVLAPEQLEWLKSGLLYISVQTTEFPDGEIRGQFFEVFQSVPEMGGTLALLIIGAAACAGARAGRSGSKRIEDLD